MRSRIALAGALVAAALVAATSDAAAQTSCTPARAMILFDRSTSMHVDLIGGATKWSAATAAVEEIAGVYQNEIELGLALFPAAPLSCSGATVAVRPALGAGAAISAGLSGQVRDMFTPIGAALADMVDEPVLNVAGRPQRYVILVTDGHEDCPSAADEQTHAQIVATVKRLHDKGISTFVVGFGQPSNGDGVDALLLNQLAVAGQTAIAGCNPNGADPAAADLCYFQADDFDGLVTALDAIALHVSAEICDGQDNNCDGRTDEGCDCIDGSLAICGQVLGECRPGTQTCRDGKWGGCEGAVQPTVEICDGLDNDCDGTTDEGCDCVTGETRACGPAAVGVCAAGTQTCDASGAWGPCLGAVMPSTEVCDGKDNDCDGTVDQPLDGSRTGLCGAGAACIAGRCLPMGQVAGGGFDCQIGGAASPAALAGALICLAFAVALLRRGRRS